MTKIAYYSQGATLETYADISISGNSDKIGYVAKNKDAIFKPGRVGMYSCPPFHG